MDRNEDEIGRLQPEGAFSSEVFSYKAVCEGLPWWLRQKESACSAGDLGLIPGLGRSPGEGNGYPLQYSCLENPMGGGVHGVAKCRTRLSNLHTLYVRAFICGGEQGGVKARLLCRHTSFSPFPQPCSSATPARVPQVPFPMGGRGVGGGALA